MSALEQYLALVRSERWEEALPLIEHLVAQQPGIPTSWHNYGFIGISFFTLAFRTPGRLVHMIPYFAGIMISGNMHQASPLGYYAIAVLQWFTVGLICGIPLAWFRTRRHASA